ncbi:MAG: hypothetical protein WCE21_02495 [Candidatus Babeliales bacterium]
MNMRLLIRYMFLVVVLCINNALLLGMGGAPGLPEGISMEEMERFVEEIQKNEPELFERLNTLGAKINEMAIKEGVDPYVMADRIGKQAEELGKDPFDMLFGPEAEPTAEPVPAPAVEKPRAEKAPKATKPLDLTRMSQARTMLDALSENLNLIKRKADVDFKARDILKSFRYLYDDMVSYTQALRTDQMITYLIDKEFEALFTQLERLDNELAYLEPRIDFPEIDVETEISPYTVLRVTTVTPWPQVQEAYQREIKKTKPGTPAYEEIVKAYRSIAAKEQSYTALNQVIDCLSQEAYRNALFTTIQQLLKKHDPEFLKRKQEQERLESTARKDQEEMARRRPPFSMPVFEQPFAGNEGRKGDIGTFAGARAGAEPILGGGIKSEIPFEGKTGMMGQPSSKPGAGGAAGTPGAAGETKEGKPGEAKEQKEGAGKEKGAEKEKEKANPRLTKKVEEVEKHLKDLSAFLQEPLGTDEDALTPVQMLKDFEQYIKTPITLKGTPITSDRAKAEMKKASLVNKALMEIVTKFSNIKKELTITIGLNVQEKNVLRAEAQKLFNLYRDKYFKDLEFLLSLKMITEDTKSVITNAGATKTINPQKAYVLTGEGMDDDEDPENDIANPINQPIKELNKGENYLGKFISTYTDLNELFKQKAG